jgi:hypothetical protein
MPTYVSPLWCTDEDIAVRAPDDFVALCPTVFASGTDGVLSALTPWLLQSASVDLQAIGLSSGWIVQLAKKGSALGSSGSLFAVDSVAPNQATLRRPGFAAGSGLAPGAGGLSSVTWKVYTYRPQIEELTYDLRQRYGVDDTFDMTAGTFVYDPRVLRRLCVMEVLYDRYTAANRASDGDWAAKVKQLADELEELRNRVTVRWGPQGNSAAPSNFFGRQISRG